MEEIYKHQRKEDKKSIFCRAMRLQEKQSKKKQNHRKTLARKYNYGEKPKCSWQTVKTFKGGYKQQLWNIGMGKSYENTFKENNMAGIPNRCNPQTRGGGGEEERGGEGGGGEGGE